ncbi:phage integrase SAM-like domain-containing protein [uncultured Chryseobacterium sp.]|uniref:phage integrase SAM-like domain-containing protein n=1 Tax=uncultured Chryseobacterium sp. TaxID=259322 RepID=UPI0025FA2097|nr:phage integrase SAM-like domain-containing protein [uncultured Chryseobacterium sp.]
MIFSFYLSRKSSSSECQIYFSFTSCSSQKANHNIRLPLFISRGDWDDEKQRPLNIYGKKYKKLNHILNLIKIKATELIEEKPEVSTKTASAILRKICLEETPQFAEGTFLSLMNDYLELKKNSVCLSTYRRYQVFMRLMEKFEGFLCKCMYTEEIDNHFIKQFYEFGRKEQYTESTIQRSAEFIKTILNFAELKGIRTHVRQITIPKSKVQRKVMTLDEKEINKIRQSRVPKKLQQAKDWLVISCYTGQRISDFMKFSNTQLTNIDGKKCISFVQQKTGKEIVLPLHPIVLKIMARYGNTFPQPLDPYIYNEQIKKVAALARINTPVKIRKRIGFRCKELDMEKWQNITSHIGRRSFASNFYGKIPTPLLMQATGHSTEQMFLNYINPVNHARVISLGNYFEKIYAEGA